MGNNSTTNRGLASQSRLGSWGSSIDDTICGPHALCGDWHDIDDEEQPLFTNPPTRRGSTLSVPEKGRRKPPPLKRAHSIGGSSIKRPATTNYSDTSDPPDSLDNFPVAPVTRQNHHHNRSPIDSEFNEEDFVPAPVATSYSSRPPSSRSRRLSEMPQPVFVDNHHHRRASEPPLFKPHKPKQHNTYESDQEYAYETQKHPPSRKKHVAKAMSAEDMTPWQDVYIPPKNHPIKPIRKEASKEYKPNYKPAPNVKKEKRIVRPKGKMRHEAPKPFIVGKPPPTKERYLVSPIENEI
uniref:Uncharacterized protein n=1 Tax=Acrobeloides nanus TaxID=290746 RepID=A0A914CGI3_9BILA